jgi:hypothetical protein
MATPLSPIHYRWFTGQRHSAVAGVDMQVTAGLDQFDHRGGACGRSLSAGTLFDARDGIAR